MATLRHCNRDTDLVDFQFRNMDAFAARITQTKMSIACNCSERHCMLRQLALVNSQNKSDLAPCQR